MNTLDTNIFTDCVCPHLTGKTIDNILLVNKHYNAVVKDDMKHLYSLFWKTKGGFGFGIGFKYIYKDGKLEGEQSIWLENGQLSSKDFYKEGKLEGEQLRWWENGQLASKEFCKEGELEGEQLIWYENGQLYSKSFYKDGKLKGEPLKWYESGLLFYSGR